MTPHDPFIPKSGGRDPNPSPELTPIRPSVSGCLPVSFYVCVFCVSPLCACLSLCMCVCVFLCTCMHAYNYMCACPLHILLGSHRIIRFYKLRCARTLNIRR